MPEHAKPLAPIASGSDFHWNEEQWSAITDRGHDLLVSAGAGSGKTSVLTERVLQLIAGTGPNDREPIPLEELLIITFTRKAARQMRERIEARIHQALAESPANSALRSAEDALPRAHILTLNAFCDRLVRKHFHAAGVAPNYRVADEEEEDEIEREGARQVFERLSRVATDGKNEEDAYDARDFALLAAISDSGHRALELLAERVHRLRRFIASLDDPQGWRDRVRLNLDGMIAADSSASTAQDDSIRKIFFRSFGDLAKSFANLQDQAVAKVGAQNLLERWTEIARELHHLASPNQEARSFREIQQSARTWFDEGNGEFLEKLKNKSNCGDALYKDEGFERSVLSPFSSAIKDFRKRWFVIDPAHQIRVAQISADQARAFLNLADKVEGRVQEIKRRRGALGFGDVERKALEILGDGPSSKGSSEIAHECRERFRHVLVDEYQDISPLQGAIIRRVSHEDDPSPNAERNLFIVGDLKQSIYRFRRAEPALFAARLDRYGSKGDADPTRRMDLPTNFRSRPGIIDCVNSVFERLMDREVGELDYDRRARLIANRNDHGAHDPVCVEAAWLMAENQQDSESEEDAKDGESEREGNGNDSSGEDKRAELRALEREAEWIARRILELTAETAPPSVWDAREERWRRARPEDCAILVRRLNEQREQWTSALARHGVRVLASRRGQLLSNPEVIDALNALRLADNPFQDIPLASVLRSPMVGLSEDELLLLRLAHPDGAFHEAVWDVKSEGLASPWNQEPAGMALQDKLGDFFDKLNRWRRLAERGEAEAVLSAVLEDTHYESYLAGLTEAAARLQNLEDFRAMIHRHDGGASGAPTLSAFLASLEGAGGRVEEDSGEETPEESASVRLLTIHKAKGLEFPIVFLPRLASPFADKRAKGDLELSAEFGMAVPAVDPERRLRLSPLSLAALRSEESRRARAEELRLLYVAMTRARDRLILIGTHHHWKSAERLREKWADSPVIHGERVPALTRLRAQSPADLLGPIALKLDAESKRPTRLRMEFPSAAPITPTLRDLPKVRAALIAEAVGDSPLWGAARREFMEVFSDDPRAKSVLDSFQDAHAELPAPRSPLFLLPYESDSPLSHAPIKIAVSRLTRDPSSGKPIWHPEDESSEVDLSTERPIIRGPLRRNEKLGGRVPRFALAGGESKMDSAALGTHTHSLLRHLDLRGQLSESGLRGQARGLWIRGLIELDHEKMLDQLLYIEIARFFQSPLGQRMVARPGSVSRELPFTRWIQASEIRQADANGTLRPLVPPEFSRPILLQGVMDCVMDEGNTAVVLDYKTDRVESRDDLGRLAQRYYVQLDEYRKAIRSIWRIPVKETYLVFLSAGENLLVPDPTA